MQIENIADYACRCGEGPAWHPLENRLYWTDIETGRMFWFDPATGKHEQFYSGPRVGGATIQADGSLLLFREKGNIVVWRGGKVVKTISEGLAIESEGRFNDVIADPEGRVFAGSLCDNGKPGRLFRLDRDGKLTQLLDGLGCANGMAFTADLKTMYFTDTGPNTIYAFAYDRKTGSLTDQRPFIQVERRDGEGSADGMTIDATGDIWSARWGGSRVTRYSADGKEKDKIALPTPNVSSLTFGGADLTEMYITTAGGDKKQSNGPAAGALFRVKAGIRGRAEFFSKIG